MRIASVVSIATETLFFLDWLTYSKTKFCFLSSTTYIRDLGYVCPIAYICYWSDKEEDTFEVIFKPPGNLSNKASSVQLLLLDKY